MKASQLKQEPPSEEVGAVERRVAFLRRIYLFGDIANKSGALEAFADVMSERVFKKGDVLIEESIMSNELFIMTSGEAHVFKNTPDKVVFKVAILNGDEGAFFGEGALIGNEPRSATIKAGLDCHCLVLGRAGFDSLCASHPEWVLPFYSRIANLVLGRLRRANEDLTCLYQALIAEIRGS